MITDILLYFKHFNYLGVIFPYNYTSFPHLQEKYVSMCFTIVVRKMPCPWIIIF